MKVLLGAVALSLLSFSLAADPVLHLTLTADEAAIDRSAGTVPLRVTIANLSNATVSNIRLTLDSNAGGVSGVQFSDPEWDCTGAPNYLQCSYSGWIDARSEITVPMTMVFPRRAGRARLQAYASYGNLSLFGDLRGLMLTMWRPFLVTGADDSGAGTLRAAIDALNADPECGFLPCRIEFAIPGVADGGWATIMLRTPLPTIFGGDLSVDATTQPDTNPHGPDVLLLGTSLLQGNGLYLRGPEMIVRGLAVAGFPDSGILYFPTARGSVFTIERNSVGTDATGRYAIPNGGRGITIAEGIVRSSAIRDNVISGNFRSGIFLVTQTEPAFPLSPVITIAGNRIGVSAASEAPIPNGASGIFVGPNAEQVAIVDNVIAHNAHFGVAVSRGARYVQVGKNRIFGHPNNAIDIGLDGADAGIQVTMQSARYDAVTNTTTVTVKGPASPGSPYAYRYSFFASTSVDAQGYAEAEEFLGVANPLADGTASVQVAGDLRGRWINALTTTIYNADGSLLYATGELTKALRVE